MIELLLTQKQKDMEASKIIQSTSLDVLFDQRNKAYGAYMLRKKYPETLLGSIVIVFVFTAFLLVFATRKGDSEDKKNIIILETKTATLAKAEKREALKPNRPKKAKAMSAKKQKVTMGVIKLVDSTEIKRDTAAVMVFNGIGSDGGDKKVGYGAGEPGDEKDTSSIGTTNYINHQFSAFEEVEIMPEFPGGMKALHAFLQENLVHPNEDEEEMTTVKIRFVVGFDGALSDLMITQDGGKSYNEEVIRVVKQMPKWKPGRSKGEKVSVYYNLPVYFIGKGE